jgi:hypothetical protein
MTFEDYYGKCPAITLEDDRRVWFARQKVWIQSKHEERAACLALVKDNGKTNPIDAIREAICARSYADGVRTS